MSHVQLSEQIFEGQWRPECVICKESVKLEESKANEYGQAIHEKCYVSELLGGVLRFTANTRSARRWNVIRFAITLTPKRGKQCL
jgi:hypothetical protein